MGRLIGETPLLVDDHQRDPCRKIPNISPGPVPDLPVVVQFGSGHCSPFLDGTARENIFARKARLIFGAHRFCGCRDGHARIDCQRLYSGILNLPQIFYHLVYNRCLLHDTQLAFTGFCA